MANPISAAATAIVGRAARATSFVRERHADESLKNLEMTRVFVAALFRDLTTSGTSTPGIEPFLLTPIVPVGHRHMKTNEAGVVVADDDPTGVQRRASYTIFPGNLAPAIAPPGGCLVEVPALRGVGSDWGSYDIVDELNQLCFPDDMIPLTGPNWLNYYDPRHHDLFPRIDAHLGEIMRGYAPNSPERSAAEAGVEATKNARASIYALFHEKARQSKPDNPAEFGPVEMMWVAQLGIEMPAWAFDSDKTRESAPTRQSDAERALDRVAVMLEAQTERQAAVDGPIPPALEARLAELEAANARLAAQLESSRKGEVKKPS